MRFFLILISITVLGCAFVLFAREPFIRSALPPSETKRVPDDLNRTPKLKFVRTNESGLSFLAFGPNGKLLGGSDLDVKVHVLSNPFDPSDAILESMIDKTGYRPPPRVMFTQDNTAWAAGGDSVFRRDPNGNWRPITEIPEHEALSIGFANEKIGYVLARSPDIRGCRVLKTVDGGKVWTAIYENTLSGNPFSMVVLSDTIVLLAINDNYVLRTDNGGKSWTPTALTEAPLRIRPNGWIEENAYGAAEFTVSPDKTVWLVGKHGSICSSIDYGLNWKQAEVGPSAARDHDLFSIAFSPDRKGVAIGRDYVLTTVDSGRTWDEPRNIEAADGDHLRYVGFFSGRFVVLGAKGIYEVEFKDGTVVSAEQKQQTLH